MENQKYIDIENSVKALFKETRPIFNEIELLLKEIKEVDLKDTPPLVELISRLTKTARKHEIETKVDFKGHNKPYKIGTNHNGVGYQDSWSNQLTPLNESSRYSNKQRDESQVRDILFNDEAVTELTTLIKKSNQKSFLKAVKILKKYNLTQSFGVFRDEELKNFSLKLDDTYSIEFDLQRGYQIQIELRDTSQSYGGHEETLKLEKTDADKITMNLRAEKNPHLKQIADKTFKDISISELKLVCFLNNHKKSIIELIKSKRDALNSVREAYQNEPKELNELLQPLLALDKI